MKRTCVKKVEHNQKAHKTAPPCKDQQSMEPYPEQLSLITFKKHY